MKKAVFLSILAVFTYMGLFAQQPVVAVAPFDAISGISVTDANMITRIFTIRLGNTQKVNFVDRSIIERVLKEHSFQAEDWSNAQKTAELGKAFNADWIVRGELEKFGSSILVTVQFYDIQTFKFMGGGDLRITNAEDAYDKMDPLVDKLINTIASVPMRHPLFGSWDGGSIVIEFKNDGTFIFSKYNTESQSIFPAPKSSNAVVGHEDTSIQGSVKGTYTYTNSSLSLDYTISGTRETQRVWGYRDNESSTGRNNFNERGTCTVSYSISNNGTRLELGKAPLFETYRMTDTYNRENSSGYTTDFEKLK